MAIPGSHTLKENLLDVNCRGNGAINIKRLSNFVRERERERQSERVESERERERERERKREPW